MNYIVYGKNKVESSVYARAKKGSTQDSTLYVDNEITLHTVLETVRYKPFFEPYWFVHIDLDKINREQIPDALKLLMNKKVQSYLTVNYRRDLYTSIRKSKILNNLDNLTILNAKFPSEEYIASMLLERVKKYFSDPVIKYVANNVRFNIEKLDQVIDDMNDFELGEITLTDIKQILPPSKTRDIKTMCYTILLCHRKDLKEHWQDQRMKILVQNAGTKVKPYKILNEIELSPSKLLEIIIMILKDMKKIKRLYMDGVITETSIFKDKDKLEQKIPFLKNITIPAIVEYIMVTSEVVFKELDYCLNSFLTLTENKDISIEQIYLTVYKLMNRHQQEEQ